MKHNQELRCPHCGRVLMFEDQVCPYCGQETQTVVRKFRRPRGRLRQKSVLNPDQQQIRQQRTGRERPMHQGSRHSGSGISLGTAKILAAIIVLMIAVPLAFLTMRSLNPPAPDRQEIIRQETEKTTEATETEEITTAAQETEVTETETEETVPANATEPETTAAAETVPETEAPETTETMEAAEIPETLPGYTQIRNPRHYTISDEELEALDRDALWRHSERWNQETQNLILGQKRALEKTLELLKYWQKSEEKMLQTLESHRISRKDGKKVIDLLEIDFSIQAYKTMLNYLSSDYFSPSQMREQLEYDKFTPEQIDYAFAQCQVDWDEQMAGEILEYLDDHYCSRWKLVSYAMEKGFDQKKVQIYVDSLDIDWRILPLCLRLRQRYLRLHPVLQLRNRLCRFRCHAVGDQGKRRHQGHRAQQPEQHHQPQGIGNDLRGFFQHQPHGHHREDHQGTGEAHVEHRRKNRFHGSSLMDWIRAWISWISESDSFFREPKAARKAGREPSKVSSTNCSDCRASYSALVIFTVTVRFSVSNRPSSLRRFSTV